MTLLLITAIACFLALILASWSVTRPIFDGADAVLLKMSATNGGAITFIFVIAMILYALPSLWRVPTPTVHDEHAYLLQGDTLAHGRLSNPPHELAKFFETFHVLQSPTYAAKFPPGLAMALCVGFWVGLPIFGVWLSTAIGCVAIYWMLLAAMNRRWAVLLALLAVFHPTTTWFSQTYWGGNVTMIGGALLGGAMLRAMKRPTMWLGLIGGVGIGVLALSRPFEGALTSIAVAIVLVVCAIRDGKFKLLMSRFVPIAMLPIVLSGAWMMYYNWRVTENPLTMPYSLYTQRYMSVPLFYWQKFPPTPDYPNEQMRKFHLGDERSEFLDELGVKNFILSALDRIGLILWAYLRPMVLVVPLGIALFLWRNRIILVCGLICVGVVLAHISLCPWMRVAYMAPLFGMLMVMLGIGLRRLNGWRFKGERLGQVWVRAIFVTTLVVGVYTMIATDLASADSPNARRAEILQSLLKQGGEHLVIVRYGPDHSPRNEWVYNAADIDHSPVIFARALGDDEDQSLLRYFSTRKIWLAEVNNREVELTPWKN